MLDEQGAIGPTLDRLSLAWSAKVEGDLEGSEHSPSGTIHTAIVVDGGSKDGTVAEAQEHGAIILQEARKGYGRACLTGAEHARTLGAEIIVFMDGDGADAVEFAERLVSPILNNEADFVLATRTKGPRQPGSMGPHQIAAGMLIGSAVGLLTRVRYTDMCAFRAIRLSDLERLDMREMTYGWNLEMQIKAARAKLRVLEVSLPYYRRVAGESKVAGNWRGSLRAGTRIVSTLIRVGGRS